MPTYEYQCEKCKNVFEEYQSITAPPLTECRVPDCGGTVVRLFSAGGGFLFKGSGFYITDYRSESYKQKAKADTSAGASGATPTPSSTPSATPAATPKTT